MEKKRSDRSQSLPLLYLHQAGYPYDEVMGITQVDPREAERFEEGLCSEYFDATEGPPDTEKPDPTYA